PRPVGGRRSAWARGGAQADRELRLSDPESGVSAPRVRQQDAQPRPGAVTPRRRDGPSEGAVLVLAPRGSDRKSTRLNSSHEWRSYAVFCLKKKMDIFYI